MFGRGALPSMRYSNASRAARQHSMDSLRILHLEDDPLDADLIHRTVERWQVAVQWRTVDSAHGYADALERGSFDAVVCDNSLPGLDGLQALQLARDAHPAIPFIVLSGNADERRALECLRAGANDYILKDGLWRLLPAMHYLRNRRERERLEHEKESLAVLIGIVKQLSTARTMADVMAIVRTGARRLTGADGATFVLRDREHCFYADEDAIEPLWKGRRFPLQACVSGWAMLNQQAAVIPDIYADPRIPIDAYRPTFVKSLVMVPIRIESPIGAIGSYWATPHEATENELTLLQALADTTSVAIENVRLYAELEERVRERTAALQHANEELQAFNYSVSHDLRAPLRAIDGFSRLLTEPPHDERLDPQARTFLGYIHTAAQRMGHIIEDLLSLSKVGRETPMPRTIDLAPMAHEVLARLQATAPQRHVEIDLPHMLPVYGDVGLLHLALENLLSNAWKYTSRRERAHIQLKPYVSPDGEHGFVVRDDGAGFDMARARHLFEPFRRMHSESEFAGTGVGLAIVRRAVQRHGGRVWAEAEPDKGACFFVVLPGESSRA
jgi:signal transduction histidine kinase/FixJ family two-component response regulator